MLSMETTDERSPDVLMKKSYPALLLLLVPSLVLTLGCRGLQRSHDQNKGDEDEQEQVVRLGDLPGSVRSTVEAHAAGARIVKIEKDDENGATIYDVETNKGGKTVEFKVAADGKYLGVDREEDGDEENGEGDED